jgi:hypothetical protein
MAFLRPATVALGRHIALKRAPIALLRTSTWMVPAATTARFMSSVTVPPAPTSNHPHKPLPNATGSIVYTETDEAPALATYSLYPYICKVRYFFVVTTFQSFGTNHKVLSLRNNILTF